MDFEQTQERKRRDRDEAIERLRDEATKRGQLGDKAFWAMVYDFEHAPVTTNRKQLAEIGIELPPGKELADDELVLKLQEVIEGLATLRIYLVHTDHLSDRQLYDCLEQSVLDEEVRDLPALDSAQEFIDLSISAPPEDDLDVDLDDETPDGPRAGVGTDAGSGLGPGSGSGAGSGFGSGFGAGTDSASEADAVPRSERWNADRDRTLPRPSNFASW
jgi:hypothetical protein